MSQAAIVINVGEKPQTHSNGLTGTFTVPVKTGKQKFGMLVLYPTPEIQDVGSGKSTVHWLKAMPLAKDVAGMRSDAAAHGHHQLGTKEKWGVLLCEAEPDITKKLEKALEAEIEYLNENPPDVKMKIDPKTKAVVATDVSDLDVRDRKQELSDEVAEARREFEDMCRSLVTKEEVQRAKDNMQREDQRLVAEGDAMWARPQERWNVNELHREACVRLGQAREWCYTPTQLVDCPGCGAKIKENILTCPACKGWLDEGVDELNAMKPRDRAVKMYPNRLEQEAVEIKN